jgi:hypothetical protein
MMTISEIRPQEHQAVHQIAGCRYHSLPVRSSPQNIRLHIG